MQVSSLNAIAGCFHAAQCIIVLGLIGWINTKNENYKNGVFPLHKSISIWQKKTNDTQLLDYSKVRAMDKDFFIEPRDISAGELDVRYVIASFFALSAIFQLVGGYLFGGRIGQRVRFIEYSYSASVMILAIGVESGIRDINTLQMMFVLIWITQMCGLLADVLCDVCAKFEAFPSEPLFLLLGNWSWVVPHVMGWVACLSAYIPIIDIFRESSNASSTHAPGFVHVIVFLQFALFSCFGLVQTYALVQKTYVLQGSSVQYGPTEMSRFIGDGDYPENTKQRELYLIEERAEMIYIILSFTAKTLLGWLIITPIIAGV